MTPSGPLTAKWRCLTVVEGSECRDRRRGGAHLLLLPRTRPVALWPGAVVGSEQRPSDRAPARSIAVEADAGAADRAGPVALRNGAFGHFSDFGGVPWSTPAGLEGGQGAAERPTVTPSGPLTAKWRCLTVVKGPNAEIAGAAVLILLLLPRSRPAALWPGAVVGSEQRPNDRAPARSIGVEADAGAADRAGPAALRNGVDGHFFGFRGVPWSTPAGLEGPLGAAERATVTPSGPLTARRP